MISRTPASLLLSWVGVVEGSWSLIKWWISGVISNYLLQAIIIGQLSTYRSTWLLFYWSIGSFLFSEDLFSSRQDFYYILPTKLIMRLCYSGLLILSANLPYSLWVFCTAFYYYGSSWFWLLPDEDIFIFSASKYFSDLVGAVSKYWISRGGVVRDTVRGVMCIHLA